MPGKRACPVRREAARKRTSTQRWHLAGRPTLPSSARTTSDSTTPQVRLYGALTRHLVLTMAALAVCAVTAAHAKTRAPAPAMPTRGDQLPPEDPGLIPLTVAEIKRLFILTTRRLHAVTHQPALDPVATPPPSPREMVPPPHPPPPTKQDNMTPQTKVRLPY
jgi:hypothetical protein